MKARDEVVAGRQLAGRGHDEDERLSGRARFADDELAEESGPVRRRVRVEPRGAGPPDDGVPKRIAERAGEPAARDRQHRVVPAGTMQPRGDTIRRVREGVVEPVAVLVWRIGGNDRLHRRLRQTCDAYKRVAYLALLLPRLRRVLKVLQTAPAAGGVVHARRRDAFRTGTNEVDDPRLAVPAPDALDPRPDAVAGERAVDEQDEAVEPGDATRSVRERVDVQLELVAGSDRAVHPSMV